MEPDDLYGLALDEFIPRRGALAKQLRGEKRRDEAAQVAALRKPSVAAWAVNQLVRSQRAGVKALFEAGDALRDTQADLLAGSGDGRTLRAANERERDAVDELVEAARGLLSSQGHELSPAIVERVADTLHAAALDEAARDQVRGGCLERELRHAGLGLGEAPAAAAEPAPARKPRASKPAPAKGTAAKPAKGAAAKPAKGAAAKPVKGTAAKTANGDAADARRRKAAAEEAREQARRDRAEREAAERERTAARKAARIAEAAARSRAERAGHALKSAEERRERAAKALAQADEALAKARATQQAAADEHDAAQAQLKQL